MMGERSGVTSTMPPQFRSIDMRRNIGNISQMASSVWLAMCRPPAWLSATRSHHTSNSLSSSSELVPGKVGMIAGLFFGFAFGMGGIGAAVLGEMADWWGIEYVYWLCSFLPLIGLLAVFLPSVERRRPAA